MAEPAPPQTNPLEDALLVVIKKTTSAVETGVDFLTGQIPDVIQQLLTWHATQAGILGSVQLAAALALAYLLYRLVKAAIDESDPFPYVLACIPVGCGVVSLGCSALANALIVAQILIAPKVYLIEYAASLLK